MQQVQNIHHVRLCYPLIKTSIIDETSIFLREDFSAQFWRNAYWLVVSLSLINNKVDVYIQLNAKELKNMLQDSINESDKVGLVLQIITIVSKNLKELLFLKFLKINHRYYMHSNVCSMLKSMKTRW